MIREKDVERLLRKKVEKAGGLCLKFISPGWSGAPDRLCLFPGGRLVFVEIKRPGERPRPLQEARHRALRSMGFKIVVLDDPGRITSFLEEVVENANDGGGVVVKP